MLTTVKCPHCRRLIGTDQEVGQAIPCPYCQEEFDIEPDLIVRSSPLKNAIIKLCIPLGYVLFVAVPMGFTIWFLANRAEKQEQEEARDAVADVRPAVKQPPAPRIKQPRPKIDNAGPAVVAPPDKKGEPPEKEKPPAPEVVVPSQPVAPPVVPPVVPPPAPAVVPPPAPPARDEVHVAPEPHDPPWRVVLVEPEVKWQTVGAVDVRLVGYAATKVPLIDAKDRVSESARPLLVIVVDVRMSATAKVKRELLSWTDPFAIHAAMFMANNTEVPPNQFPRGTKLNAGFPAKQPLPADRTPVRDVLVFTIPPDGAGELSLRLAGERCGEPSDIWFKIPADSWKMK